MSGRVLPYFFLAGAAFAATFDGRQPQLAATGSTVAMTFASGQTIWLATSKDGGRAWGDPVRVADSPVLSLGNHRGPRVAMSERVIIVSAISGEKGRGEDGDLKTWRSTDGGRTWSAGPRVNDAEGSAREGLHNMASGPHGEFYAVWLDDRNGKKALYGALSEDGGVTWTNRRIYQPEGGSVCECCHPSVAFGPDGAIYAMFRNSLAGSRDMYLAVSRDRGRSFEERKLGEGTWKLEACPMDGGGLSAGRGGVETAWRRAGVVYRAAPGEREHEVASGKNPALSGKWLAWTATDGLYASRLGDAPRKVDEKGAFPALAETGRTAVLAYEREGRIAAAVLE